MYLSQQGYQKASDKKLNIDIFQIGKSWKELSNSSMTKNKQGVISRSSWVLLNC